MEHPLIESMKKQPSGTSRRTGLPPTLLFLILRRLESTRLRVNDATNQVKP